MQDGLVKLGSTNLSALPLTRTAEKGWEFSGSVVSPYFYYLFTQVDSVFPGGWEAVWAFWRFLTLHSQFISLQRASAAFWLCRPLCEVRACKVFSTLSPLISVGVERAQPLPKLLPDLDPFTSPPPPSSHCGYPSACEWEGPAAHFPVPQP